MKKKGASFKEAPFFLPPDSGRSFPHKLHNTFFPDFYGSFVQVHPIYRLRMINEITIKCIC